MAGRKPAAKPPRKPAQAARKPGRPAPRPAGRKPPSALPRATVATTRAAAALRIYRADKALRDAEVERAIARADGVRCGVLFDHVAHPEPAGTTRVVYADKVVQLSLVVVEPIAGINFEAFVQDLLKAKVNLRLVNRLTVKHTTETRPAHKFTAALVGSV